MKIDITKTDYTFEMGGLKHRLWDGKTAGGLDVDVIVQSVRPKREEDLEALGVEFGDTQHEQMPDGYVNLDDESELLDRVGLAVACKMAEHDGVLLTSDGYEHGKQMRPEEHKKFIDALKQGIEVAFAWRKKQP